jgi:tripartite ATP-independent transporter DctP family solute receptor
MAIEISDSDPSYDLIFSVGLNESSTWYQGAQMFAENVKKDTNGKINITVFANDQLTNGNQQKAVEMVLDGSLAFDMHCTFIWSVIDDKFSAFSLPFFFDGYEDVDRQIAGPGGQEYKKVAEQYGGKIMGWFENGMRELTNSKKEIKQVSDLSGMKIRVPSVSLFVEGFTAMGANPVVMSWSETFTGLQQGAIDGQENPHSVNLDNSVCDVNKYVTNWDWVYDAVIMVMNKKLYDSMPAKYQQVIDQRAAEAAQWQKKTVREINIKALEEEVAKRGVSAYTPTPQEKETFIKATSGILALYESKVGKDYIDLFRQGKI